MEIAAGIAAVTQGLGIAKAMRSIEKAYGEATFKAQIAELIGSLTDAKLALAEAKDDMAAKNKEIERLKAAFEDKAKLAKGPDDYDYKADDEGRPIGYPICPKCHETDGRIVQLKQNVKHNAGQCPVPRHRPAQRQRPGPRAMAQFHHQVGHLQFANRHPRPQKQKNLLPAGEKDTQP